MASHDTEHERHLASRDSIPQTQAVLKQGRILHGERPPKPCDTLVEPLMRRNLITICSLVAQL